MFGKNNPLSADAMDQRRSDIESAYTTEQITSGQRQELLDMEGNTGSWIKARYAALAVICLTIGMFFLLS